jgi:hypothetical protein
MDPGAFDGRRNPREEAWSEREATLEYEGLRSLFGRQESQRDSRDKTFLAPQTGPKSRIDDPFNAFNIGDGS